MDQTNVVYSIDQRRVYQNCQFENPGDSGSLLGRHMVKILLYQFAHVELAADRLKKSGWVTVERQFHTCKQPSIYADDFLLHSLSVYLNIFTLSAQNVR